MLENRPLFFSLAAFGMQDANNVNLIPFIRREFFVQIIQNFLFPAVHFSGFNKLGYFNQKILFSALL